MLSKSILNTLKFLRSVKNPIEMEKSMKHMIRKLFGLCLSFLIALTLAGCAQAAKPADYPGEYTLTGMKYADGQEMEDFGDLGMAGKMVLNEDGTGYYEVFGARSDLTYDIENKMIASNGNESEFTYEKDVLSVSLDGTFIYEFQKN